MKLTVFRRLHDDVRGATAIEYGLIVSLIVIAIIGSLNLVAGEFNIMWNNIGTSTQNAMD